MESIPVHCESQNCLIKYKKKKKKCKYHHRCDVFLEIPQFALRLVHVDDHKATAGCYLFWPTPSSEGQRGGGDLQKKLCRKSAPGFAGCSFVCLFVCLSSRSTSCGKDLEPEVHPRVWPRFRPLRFPQREEMLLFCLYFPVNSGGNAVRKVCETVFFFRRAFVKWGFCGSPPPPGLYANPPLLSINTDRRCHSAV